MAMMFPANATTNPAPRESRTSRMVTVKPSGAPVSFWLSEKEYCVLAMHTGISRQPSFSSFLSAVSTPGANETSFAPYTRLQTASIFAFSGASSA